MPPLREDNIVHFCEVFLTYSDANLSDEDIKSIAVQLTDDPDAGQPVPNCPGLRRIERCAIASGKCYEVWYLTFDHTPHIEVIAASDSDSLTTNQSLLTTRALWKVVRIGLVLRSAYRAIRMGTDNLDQWL